jgi:anti-sigma factor RsiW
MLCPIQEKGNAEVLLAYCARALDPGTQAVLERHIEACPECRRFAAEQRMVWEALDSWKAEPVSADFDRRLYARIEEESSSRWWQRIVPAGMHLSWRPALSVAAACVTLVAVFLLRAPDMPGVRPQPAKVETVDVEQAERTLEDMEMLRQFSLGTPGAEVKSAETL